MAFRRQGSRDGPGVIGLIAALVLLGALLGLGRAPVSVAQAESFNYEAEIAKVPLFALLAKQHPELRQRFRDVFRDLESGGGNATVAYFRLMAILNDYIPRYFAISSPVAIQAYISAYTTMLRHLYAVDRAMCRDFIHGRRMPPPNPTNYIMLRNLGDATYNVVDNALREPFPAASPAWVRRTAERLWARQRGMDRFLVRFSGIGCRDLWTLFDVARNLLQPLEYTSFVGGLIYQVSRTGGTRT